MLDSAVQTYVMGSTTVHQGDDHTYEALAQAKIEKAAAVLEEPYAMLESDAQMNVIGTTTATLV
jgi:hypothetical protein